MARIILALSVTINLTLVCMGHDEDDHRTEIHLTFLGEPDHDHSLVEVERTAADAGSERISHGALTQTQTPACTMVTLSDNSLPEGHAVSTLGAAMAALLAAMQPISRFLRPAAWVDMGSQ